MPVTGLSAECSAELQGEQTATNIESTCYYILYIADLPLVNCHKLAKTLFKPFLQKFPATNLSS